MRYALFLAAAAMWAQTKVSPAQLQIKPVQNLSLAVVDQKGKLTTATIGNGLTIMPSADGTYFLSCTYQQGGLPGRVTLKAQGQVVTLDGMPRAIDIYRNGVLMSPDDGDYSLSQVGGKTTITFSAAQPLDPSDIIRAIYWQ